jgi:hypothetical protein
MDRVRATSEEITPESLTTDDQSIDSSNTNRMPRRDLFRLAGISVAATSFGGVSLAFADSAAAKEVSNQCLQVTNLPSDHFLRKAAIEASKEYTIGKNIPFKLDLNLKSGMVGSVHEFIHSDVEAQQLGRKTSVIEGTVTGLVTGSPSMVAIKKYLAENKETKLFAENSNFIAITIRRRNTEAADRLNLFKEFPIAEQSTIVYGFRLDEKSNLLTCAVLPTFKARKSKKRVRPGIHVKAIPQESKPVPPPPAPVPPPESTTEEKDFMGCFLPCFTTLEGSAAPLTGTFCAACLVAIAALPPTAGLDTPAVLVTCGGCFFFFLAPIGICFVACADQL